MINVTQCNPPIPCWIPKKKMYGLVVFRIEYGIDFDTYYDVWQDDGEIWMLNNKEIRAVDNTTYERKLKQPKGEKCKRRSTSMGKRTTRK